MILQRFRCSVCLFILHLRLINKKNFFNHWALSIEGWNVEISWVRLFHFIFFLLPLILVHSKSESMFNMFFFSFSIYSFAGKALCRSRNEKRFYKKKKLAKQIAVNFCFCRWDLNALKVDLVVEENPFNLNSVIKWPKIVRFSVFHLLNEKLNRFHLIESSVRLNETNGCVGNVFRSLTCNMIKTLQFNNCRVFVFVQNIKIISRTSSRWVFMKLVSRSDSIDMTYNLA